RRPRDFKVCHSCPGYQDLQQSLRIARTSDFLVVALIGELFDSGKSLERAHAVLSRQSDGVEAVVRLDFIESAVQNFLPSEYHEDAIAEPLGNAHVMGRQNDRDSGFLEVEDCIFENFRIDRVKS